MTTYNKYDELNKIANEIENNIQRAMTDPKILSDLSVRVQSLSDMLKKQEKTANINSLVIRCNFFKRKIKEFSNQRILERNNIENEMKTAKLKTRKISEVNLEGQNVSEDNFYQAQSNVIDNFILTTMDSLNSLKKQDVLIKRANARFVNVLKRIGISGDLIRNMERRIGKDRNSLVLIKRNIGRIPFLGYLIQQFDHVYLTQFRNLDIRILEKMALEIKNKEEYNIAMCPEGTYIFSKSLEKAQQYTSEANIMIDKIPFHPCLILLPRCTDFNTITKTLGNNFDGVIEMTIMMNPYVFMPSEEITVVDLFFEQNRIISQCFLVDFIPRNEIEVDFLEKSFKKKQNKLKNYVEFIKKKNNFKR